MACDYHVATFLEADNHPVFPNQTSHDVIYELVFYCCNNAGV